MSPNKEAVHGCSSYLHCSYSGEAVVRMCVGSGQTVELSSGGFCFLPFYISFLPVGTLAAPLSLV